MENMTNSEILEKAIAQAASNGFTYNPVDKSGNEIDVEAHELPERLSGDNQIALIFSHDFAKAFWGEEYLNIDQRDEILEDSLEVEYQQIAYMYHLQQQVISDDPIQYLKRGIKKAPDETG